MIKGLLWTGRALLLIALFSAGIISWRMYHRAAPIAAASRLERPAPMLPYAWLNGEPGRLAQDFAGRPVLVHFWATWCESCVRELPRLLPFAHGRIPVIAIAVDDHPDAVRRFFGGRVPRIVARTAAETARAFGVDRLPTTFVVDAQGQLRLQMTGEWDWTQPGMQIQVLAAAGLPLTIPSAPARE